MSEFWQDRPTLVTGATGLLGGWLVKRLLAEGADVTCLVRTMRDGCELYGSGDYGKCSLVMGDVTDAALMFEVVLESCIDVVFHLAAQTAVGVANRDPSSTWATNVGGTVAVLEACRRGKVSACVVASSDKAYGEQSNEVPCNEHRTLNASAPYDVSKACADMIARSYASSFGLPAAVTRCGNLYGGGDLNWSRVVPGTIRSATRGQRPVLRSDGLMVRDYLHVDDAVEAYLMLAESLVRCDECQGEAFNFSGGKPMSVQDMVGCVLQAMGSGLTPVVGKGKPAGEIAHQALDCTKARDVLGWRSRVYLAEGLVKTVAWYRGYFA